MTLPLFHQSKRTNTKLNSCLFLSSTWMIISPPVVRSSNLDLVSISHNVTLWYLQSPAAGVDHVDHASEQQPHTQQTPNINTICSIVCFVVILLSSDNGKSFSFPTATSYQYITQLYLNTCQNQISITNVTPFVIFGLQQSVMFRISNIY